MKLLCTVCMRSGSKGVINKNYRKINKKYLFQYTLDQIKKVKVINNYIISTDSEKIIEILKKNKENNYFKRKKSLATDKTPKLDVIKDSLKKAEEIYKTRFDIIIDLDVTSPLRSINDINSSIKKFIKHKKGNLVSVTTAKKNPYFNMVELKQKKVSLVKKSSGYFTRQSSPKVYELNASIYIWTRDSLFKSRKIINKDTILFEMPEERSIDIDTKFDFLLINKILKK